MPTSPANPSSTTTLWYTSPANQWTSALPLGNGRLGGMLFGGPHSERIQLNEESLWSGGGGGVRPRSRLNPDAASTTLPKVRQLLLEGKIREAEKLANLGLLGTPQSMRHYETLGDIDISFDGIGDGCLAGPYRRWLDLSTATAGVRFVDAEDGTVYEREVFVSGVDDVIVMRFVARGSVGGEGKGAGRVGCQMRVHRRIRDEMGLNVAYERGWAERDGKLTFMTGTTGGGDDGIKFAAGLAVLDVVEGEVETVGEFLVVKHAKEVTVLCGAATSFGREEGEEPVDVVRKMSVDARRFTYPELRARHVKEWEKLYGGFEFELYPPPPPPVPPTTTLSDPNSFIATTIEHHDAATYDPSTLPTDLRLAHHRTHPSSSTSDPSFIALLVAYARYLLLSSSHPHHATLPANLQGIWNPHLSPPWGSKFTLNINLEMNYWFAYATGLGGCEDVLFDFIERIRADGERTAREMYGCHSGNVSGDGGKETQQEKTDEAKPWLVHHNTDLTADTAPQDRYPPASYWTLNSAWLCVQMLERYWYSLDAEFLVRKLPTLIGAVRFYLQTLQPLVVVDGVEYLVTNPSVSPENSYRTGSGREEGSMCVGPMCDFMVLRELFRGVIAAVESLGPERRKEAGVEEGFVREMKEVMGEFPPVKISERYEGTIQEWLYDHEQVEPGHRHVSHLFALYPGTAIHPPTAPGHEPVLWHAARKTLEDRLRHGGAGTGWSRAWTVCFFARLLDGEEVGKHMSEFGKGSLYENLMDAHPPFQIDGNFGVVAGVLEGVLQSHFVGGDGVREVWLLPALPQEWSCGKVRGLRIRGGWVVDMEWRGGKVRRVEVMAERVVGGVVRVRVRWDVERSGGGRLNVPERDEKSRPGRVEEIEGEEAIVRLEMGKGENCVFEVSWDDEEKE